VTVAIFIIPIFIAAVIIMWVYETIMGIIEDIEFWISTARLPRRTKAFRKPTRKTRVVQRNSGNRGTGSVIYLWEAVDVESYDGDPVYKIGVTSISQGTTRIERVARKHSLKHRIERIEKTIGSAFSVEKALLKLGYAVDMDGIDGHTEFRAMTQQDLIKANRIISAAMV